MVAEVRKQMEPEEPESSSVPARPVKREGKDGKMRTVAKKKETKNRRSLKRKKLKNYWMLLVCAFRLKLFPTGSNPLNKC